MVNDTQDNLIVQEVGEHWLRCRWSISDKTMSRAVSAMGRDSHRAKRILRIHRIKQDESGPKNRALHQEIVIPSQSNEWFIHAPSKDDAWGLELGMAFGDGRFFSMLQAPAVALTGTYTQLQTSKKFLGDERLLSTLSNGESLPLQVRGQFSLQGRTRPGAIASVDDQDVAVDRTSGDFKWQTKLTDGRLVVPVKVSDGLQIQRALLSIDLNFHLLEPEPSSDI
ncbi:DUF4912 domain-containing protein [Planctomicrobium sp. SH668]|uniref:DUF4912 domain-containing protein n=1 Tax=Planctomicrobium sp. SH668 TaxID=3448126 RepID=UPI003F5BA1F8